MESAVGVGAPKSARLSLTLAALGAACLLGVWAGSRPEGVAPGPSGEEEPALVSTFRADTARELCRVLEEVWAGHAAGRGLPRVAPVSLPPDMERLDVEERKRAFVRAVTPYVREENERIARERRGLEELGARLRRGETPRAEDRRRLHRLLVRYRLANSRLGRWEGRLAETVEELLRRVDEVPLSLALAQAALESAWGCSRMAVEGNALFGQTVRTPGAGLAPRGLPRGSRHAVARFPDLRESVRSYLSNLNCCKAYRGFRTLRARLRLEGGDLNAWALAQGLLPYAKTRGIYVDSVREILRGDTLGEFGWQREDRSVAAREGPADADPAAWILGSAGPARALLGRPAADA